MPECRNLTPWPACPARKSLSACATNFWIGTTATSATCPGVTRSDPYAIWVSEIMLQQTRVAVVIERWKAFLERFPTVEALAAADEQDVLALWSGLGYYRRARMLHKAAQTIVAEHAGKMPTTAAELRQPPGHRRRTLPPPSPASPMASALPWSMATWSAC